MDKFWNFIKNEETSETELYFEGPISSSTWYGDELTPALFKDELNKHPGNLRACVHKRFKSVTA